MKWFKAWWWREGKDLAHLGIAISMGSGLLAMLYGLWGGDPAFAWRWGISSALIAGALAHLGIFMEGEW